MDHEKGSISGPVLSPAVLSALSLILILISGCGPTVEIVDRPIAFPQERVEGTRAYISEHYGLDASDVEISPRIIVLHWTAIGDFEKTFDVFDKITLEVSRPELAKAGNVNVSSHFLVDRDGTIVRLMPETWMARHTIGLNYSSIGVENVGGVNGDEDLTEAQVAANVRLVNYLASKYDTIEYLIGHYEYRQFEDHPLWLEVDSGYRTVKTDPGPRFMREVRSLVSNRNLAGAPERSGE